MSQLNQVIAADLFRIHGTLDKKTLNRCLRYPGFNYLFLLRKWQLSSTKISKRFFKYRIIRTGRRYGFQIPAKTRIGKGFRIYHFGNIVINPNVVIGENCSIYPNTILGNIDYGEKKGTPVIGNKVWIGANSIIVGKISVGNNVLIAPGAYVNFSVPDNSLVIGNPGRIIAKENPTLGYIENIINE